MKRYVCTKCGYIYDPKEHDNVAFDNLPDVWVCPGCGALKSEFKPLEE